MDWHVFVQFLMYENISAERSVGWLVGWLAGWLAGWVVGWLVGWLEMVFVYDCLGLQGHWGLTMTSSAFPHLSADRDLLALVAVQLGSSRGQPRSSFLILV